SYNAVSQSPMSKAIAYCRVYFGGNSAPFIQNFFFCPNYSKIGESQQEENSTKKPMQTIFFCGSFVSYR
ncbi:MAG: hypothetical protein P9L95_06075, partial [Candidatus Tenebribacter mawsonii]|nr:hypothetical protein [Candidatus Tenebribacter mawsonii]